MSDIYQKFVPVDMHWQPARSKAEAAVALLWAMAPETHDIDAYFSEKLEFQDPIRFWSGVRCPACSSELSTEWFYDTINEWYKTQSDDLQVVMPCCDAHTTLDVLDYRTPATFARFVLTVTSSMTIISDEQIKQLEECLGTKLRLIWSWL